MTKNYKDPIKAFKKDEDTVALHDVINNQKKYDELNNF
jgi:hypothetical protein